MRPIKAYTGKSPQFWALTKLASQLIGYSNRKSKKQPSTVKTYTSTEIREALVERGLSPPRTSKLIDEVAAYSGERAHLLSSVETNLMKKTQAKREFMTVKKRVQPPDELLPMNKQKGTKRHPAYLTGIVNMLTWEGLTNRFGDEAAFVHNPREPLTFSKGGMPLRTLFRWMDGAYPTLNHPIAAWEVKEYYGTKTFGSRVADGVYETALDGYELEDLNKAGIDVQHYLFVDDHYTWWTCGKSYLCRIVDMLHSGLLDGAFFGREVLAEWPTVVASWPKPLSTTK